MMIEGTLHYLIQWERWLSEYNQWIAATDVNAPQSICKVQKEDQQGRH